MYVCVCVRVFVCSRESTEIVIYKAFFFRCGTPE